MDANIIKLAKTMKRDFIEINQNRIAGTDINRSILSYIYQGSDEYYLGTMAELEGKKIPDFWMPLDRLKYDMIRLESNIHDIVSRDNNVLYIEKDIKDNESFMYAMSRKASEGAVKFKSGENYIMYLFSSLHPINKPDSVSMKIYAYDNISYLAEYIINKKQCNIIEYIRYLYL